MRMRKIISIVLLFLLTWNLGTDRSWAVIPVASIHAQNSACFESEALAVTFIEAVRPVLKVQTVTSLARVLIPMAISLFWISGTLSLQAAPKKIHNRPETDVIRQLSHREPFLRENAGYTLANYGTVAGLRALWEAVQNPSASRMDREYFAVCALQLMNRLHLNREQAADVLHLASVARTNFISHGILSADFSMDYKNWDVRGFYIYSLGFDYLGPAMANRLNSYFIFNENQMARAIDHGDTADGYFSEANDSIGVLAHSEGLAVLAHEMGHSIWKELSDNERASLVEDQKRYAEDFGKYISPYAQTGDPNNKTPGDTANQALAEVARLWVTNPSVLFDEQSGIGRSPGIRHFVEVVSRAYIVIKDKQLHLQTYLYPELVGDTVVPYMFVPWDASMSTYEGLLASHKKAMAMRRLWTEHPEQLFLQPVLAQDPAARFWTEHFLSHAEHRKNPLFNRYGLTVHLDPVDEQPLHYAGARKIFMNSLEKEIVRAWTEHPEQLLAQLAASLTEDDADRFIEKTIQRLWKKTTAQAVRLMSPPALHSFIPEIEIHFNHDGFSLAALRAAYDEALKPSIQRLLLEHADHLFWNIAIDKDPYLQRRIAVEIEKHLGQPLTFAWPNTFPKKWAQESKPFVYIPIRLTGKDFDSYKLAQNTYRNYIEWEIHQRWETDPDSIILHEAFYTDPKIQEALRSSRDYRQQLGHPAIREFERTHIVGDAQFLADHYGVFLTAATPAQAATLRRSFETYSEPLKRELVGTEIIFLNDQSLKSPHLFSNVGPRTIALDRTIQGTMLQEQIRATVGWRALIHFLAYGTPYTPIPSKNILAHAA